MANKLKEMGADTAFARKQLEKHGWAEGKGLGKEESGISKAIKVNIKTDTAGVGYDAGDQFSFHWWDHVFNKTAKSIVVQESNDGVEVVKSGKESCVISSKRPSKNSNKSLLYGRFVKASSQTPKRALSDSEEDTDEERDFSNLSTEDKVFQACGGRTAHNSRESESALIETPPQSKSTSEIELNKLESDMEKCGVSTEEKRKKKGRNRS
ncbi:G patch domain-containing protein 4-like [Pocillopora damicornis]|uniref:G patch domain-containing protein 4-like n=1 Tax=Pocillopora damicornis TaxID=46731 RepID=UPI000F556F95|nr:G patch domain-containing protein 4-like [Pocillopora damicornis]